jgi:ribosomal protein S12 methylthiotransferase
MTVTDDPEDADVVLVNTCTFIAPAKQESIDTVLAACDLKQAGARAVLVVGCMAERYPEELAEAIPEADAVVGFDAYPRLPAMVGDLLDGRTVPRVVARDRDDAPATTRTRALPLLVMPTSDDEAFPERARPEADGQPLRVTTPQDDLDRMPASGPRFPVRTHDGRPWAYLKIASGCDRVCTFCAIPSFRGRFRSRGIDELVAEASWLVDNGARELVLVSENTTSYGKDLGTWRGRDGGRQLQPALLDALTSIERLERVRLMYLQPAELQRPLLEAMAADDCVAGYYDLSLQHVSHDVLTRMARSGSPQRFGELIASIRELDPGAVFRSSFILGFPGETERDVDELEAFLVEHRLDWVGLFTFSAEDGTPSATMDGQVPHELAHERLERIREVAERMADDAARGFVGRHLDVTVETVEPGLTAGRSYREAPDTDGEVQLVDAAGREVDLPVGRTVTAEVVDAVGVDLVAVPRG